MKLLFENWRKYLKEDPISELSLPFSSQSKIDKEVKKLEKEIAGEEHASAWDKIKQEIKETGDAYTLLKKSFRQQLTDDEKEILWTQIKDIVKGTTLGAMFAAPGGSLLLPIVLKYTGTMLKPTAFKEEQNETPT